MVSEKCFHENPDERMKVDVNVVQMYETVWDGVGY